MNDDLTTVIAVLNQRIANLDAEREALHPKIEELKRAQLNWELISTLRSNLLEALRTVQGLHLTETAK